MLYVHILPPFSHGFSRPFFPPKVGELGPALQRLRSPSPSAVAPAVEALREELCSVEGEAHLFGPFFHGFFLGG